MMPDDKLKPGIALIEQQHQQLMDLMQFLRNTSGSNQNPTQFLETLVEINELAREHFNLEESLLAQAGYEKLEMHVHQHERILYDLNDLIMSSMHNEPAETGYTELILILTDWFEKHLSHEDTHAFSQLLTDAAQQIP